MAAITFQVVEGIDKGRIFPDLVPPVTIGRGRKNLVRLFDERVSYVHARVDLDNDVPLLTDLDSANGTLVNGIGVKSRRLEPGDRVGVGQSVLLFGSEAEILLKEQERVAGGSITHMLGKLRLGEDEAAREIWDRYWPRLVGLARDRLRGAPRRVADEEDVALSVFDSFCRRAAQDGFRQLDDRDDLWQLLVMLTARKALRLVDHERRQKRGGGQVKAEVDLSPGGPEEGALLDRITGREPDPELAAQVADECSRLLHLLTDEQLRRIALWKMEGYTNAEVAAKLGCDERTVERKVREIRRLWEGLD
jgi:DNA-directed RNA polymerase specialized sigma24 family protein